MKQKRNLLERTVKIFSSFQLAIAIIIALAVLAAWGTILQARYNTRYAQEMVYHSPYMYFTLGLLCICLFNVIVDRYPWKRYHLGFILVHIGIIMLCVGALITRVWGVDGTMTLNKGQTNSYLQLTSRELAVFAAFANSSPVLIKSKPVDFLLHPPSKYPIDWKIGHTKLVVEKYYNWANAENRVDESNDPHDGPAIRVELNNQMVNFAQWVNRPFNVPYETFDLGPAQIVYAAPNAKFVYKGGNKIVLRDLPHENPSDPVLIYQIYSETARGVTKSGRIHIAQVVQTGWMGLKLRVLRYFPHAEQRVVYVKQNEPSTITTSAVLVKIGGQQHWIGLDNSIQYFDNNAVYYITYRHSLMNLGINFKLLKFVVGHYQGTNRAKSYQSYVHVSGVGNVKIYMNHPLKYKGYTFYQASFQQNGQGKATTSVLSVNKDPGRATKYIGSLLIVLGTIVMFYFKHYRLKIFGRPEDSSQEGA